MSDTKQITIQKQVFTVSAPYAEGHTITEAEAAALNQTRAENIRNNMAKRVKEANDAVGQDAEGNQLPLDKKTFEALQAEVAEYDANYEFTMASVGGGRAPTDPVDVEARRIAKASITAQLRAQGRTLKSITHTEDGVEIEGGRERLAAAIAKVAATDAVQKVAKKTVADRNAMASADLSSLNL